MQYSNLESILIKNSQTGFYISTPDGKLLDCNDSFVKMFGYDSKEEVLKLNTTNFVNGFSIENDLLGNPTRIKADRTGKYNLQFSAQ